MDIMAENTDKRHKEEKERLLDEKMQLIRQKNEARLKRQKEIEEDIKNANRHSDEIANKRITSSMSGVKTTVMQSHSKFRGRARGKILEKMSKEKPQAQKYKERQKENYKLVEKELKDDIAPKKHGFLNDDRRIDMSKIASRSTHSWGGSQFDDVVNKV